MIGTLNRGGAETQLVGLAQELGALGHDVEVILIHERGPLATTLDASRIPVVSAGYVGMRGLRTGRGLRGAVLHNCAMLIRILRMLAYVRSRDFDVIHAFLYHSYALLMPFSWLTRVPVRVAARRGLHASLTRSLLLLPLTRLSTATATAVTANCDAVARDAQTFERVPESKMTVIPNAVDIPSSRAQPGAARPGGVMVANLIDYKGHLDLVRAVTLLPPEVKRQVSITCLGEGPMRPQIEAALRDAGLQDHIRLEGSRPSGEYYTRAQYAILVSHEEGLPNAILEAMAAGLPVVATDVGGCRELVRHEESGLLAPPHDADALAAALSRMIQDREFRVSAGRRGRQLAAQFTWGRSAAAHEALYRSLMPRSRSRHTR